MNAAERDPSNGEERRVAAVLGTAVLVAIVLLGGVRALTAERAAEVRAERLADRLEEVLADLPFDAVDAVATVPTRGAVIENPAPGEPVSGRAASRRVESERAASGREASGKHRTLRLHRAHRDGRTVGAVLRAVAPDGYGGPIELLVGVRADGTVTGVSVLSHRETPGLGDRIERRRSDWITAFDGRSLERPGWRVTRTGAGGSFDALSGATITSRAVVDAVHRALVGFAAHRDEVPAR